MTCRRTLAAAWAGLALLAPGVLRAQTTLTLPIPERDTLPREKISLTIRLPEKVERAEDPPAVRPKIRSAVFDQYDFAIAKPIPRKEFVYDTLNRLERLGISPDLASTNLAKKRNPEYRIMARCIWAYYEKLLDVYRKDALGHFELVPLDIERFRQVMDIFGPQLATEYRPVLEADRTLGKMIELLKKIRGQGTVKVVEVKEADDGSMVLEIEVRKTAKDLVASGPARKSRLGR